jgi:hypothetical protein
MPAFELKPKNPQIEQGYCSRCNRKILWLFVSLADGSPKAHPVDEPDWNLPPEAETPGSITFSKETGYFRVLRSAALASYKRLGGRTLQSHFESCPFADEFRRRKPARKNS